MAKERLITAREVASYLRCSISTVRRMVLRGQVPHYRLGRMIRFRRSEIDAWLAVHQGGEPVPEARSSSSNPAQLSLFESDGDPSPAPLTKAR
jgi:excisionase family DNA binding protein